MRQFLQRRVVIEGAPRDQTIKKIIGVLNKRWDGKVLRRRWNKNERAKESCKKMQRKIYLGVFFAVKRRALCSIVSNANQTKRSLLIEEYLHNSRWSTEKLTESVPLLSQFEWPHLLIIVSIEKVHTGTTVHRTNQQNNLFFIFLPLLSIKFVLKTINANSFSG